MKDDHRTQTIGNYFSMILEVKLTIEMSGSLINYPERDPSETRVNCGLGETGGEVEKWM